MKTKSIKIIDIAIDGGTQQREKLDIATITEYAESMKCGAKFPPVVVFFDGAQHWLADGFHRYWASKDAEFLDMLCDVHEGTNRDALLFSAGANMAHGLRLSNSDKRRSVLVLLNDAEWIKWTDTKISIHCKVSQQLVSKIRNELSFGVKKEKKSTTVVALTPEAAPVVDLTFPETPISAQTPQISEPVYNPADDDDLAEAHSTIRILAAENDALKDALATGALPNEEIQPAADTIAELRARVRSLEINLAVVTVIRDGLMREAGELKKQCAMQQKELKKLRK